MWWLVGSLIFGVGIALILIVVGASKLNEAEQRARARHPVNRYLP